jgi:hypothetical protein
VQDADRRSGEGRARPRVHVPALSTPHVLAHLRLQTERRLAVAAARAGHTKIDLLNSDSEIVRDRASSFVLGLACIQPASNPSVSLNLEIKAGSPHNA